jgi:hypothetical protein
MLDDLDPCNWDSDTRDIEVEWVELGQGPRTERTDDETRERHDDSRDRRGDSLDRKLDPRDVFVAHLELPRGEDGRQQIFYADVSRMRELSHDAQLYRAYVREAEQLRERGADIRRVVLDHELKREYRQWLQAHNRGRADSDGRPDRDAREVDA